VVELAVQQLRESLKDRCSLLLINVAELLKGQQQLQGVQNAYTEARARRGCLREEGRP
jgi:hypothetical protein